jgi:hypothetical protein
MGPAAFGVTRRSTMGHVASVPDGQIAGLPIGVRVQPPLQKFLPSLLTQITCISFAIPSHTKGRFAIVTDVGHGMRWTRVTLLTRAQPCGRRSRVVLTPRRWRQVGDDASHHAGDGGKQARSPGRARRKPLKPLRGECRAIRRDRGD